MGAPLDDCFYFTTVADLILGNIYSWQFLSSEKSLARKKVIYLKDFTDLNFFLSFLFFFFCILFDKCLFVLPVTQSVCCTLSNQPFCWLGDNTMILSNFENLNYILNIFQGTHYFLVLMDPVTTCMYLRTTNRHFRDQGNVRHPTSNLLKCDLVQVVNTFRNPYFNMDNFSDFRSFKILVTLFYYGNIYMT